MLNKTKTLIDKYTNILVVTGLLLVIVATLTGGISLSFSKKSRTAKATTATVSTSPASNLTNNSADLNGDVSSPDSLVTSRGFEWGTDTSYGNNLADTTSSPVTYKSKFGADGSGDGEFSNPNGIATDSSGNIYVADGYNNRIQKFNSSGVYQSQFGTSGSGDGEFNGPSGIDLDSSGNIYVVDLGNNRIQKFNSSGVYQSQFGTTGSGDGDFSYPNGIAIDSSGNIYVTDTLNNRIQKFNSSGVYQSQFGSYGSGNGEFKYPYNVAIDSSSNIYVADTGNNRIQKFNSSGLYQSQFGSYGSGDGEFSSPIDISINNAGNIYITDINNSRIEIFDSSGAYQSQFGSYGSGNGEFLAPNYITFDNDGNVLVTDMNLMRVQIFYDAPGFPAGSFSLNLTGLTCDTTYHYRAYATNADGTSYGEDQTFAPPCLEAVTVGSSSPYFNTQTLQGNITISADTITARGFQWGNDTSYGNNLYDSGSSPFAAGAYSLNLSGLTCGNTYHFRAFGTNSYGTYYGADSTFSMPCMNLTTQPAGSVTQKSAIFNGTVGATIDNINILGFEYGTTTGYGGSIGTSSSGTSLAYKFKFGTLGSGNGEFWGPYDVATDSSGNIYVVDSFNNRIQKFNSSGVYQSQFGTSGSGDGEFNAPYSVATDSSGNIYVADAGNNRIQKFNSFGVYQSQFGTTGSGDGELNGPYDIATDSSGNIYVADTGNDRIQKFNSSGVYQSQFGTSGSGDGEFNAPFGIALDSSGNIYVADTNNNRVQKFNSSGVYQSQFGSYGSGDGEFYSPIGIAFDPSGNIYVADNSNSRIEIFNSSGVYQSQFGSYGTGDGEFKYPYGLNFDNSGNLYIADTDNNRLQVYTQSNYPTGPFTAEPTDLNCNTLYHYRAYGTNGYGTYYGNDQTFTTQGCTTVNTLPASGVGASSAMLNGNVVETLSSIIGQGFQLGTSTSYGTNIPYTPSATTLAYKFKFGTLGSGDGEFYEQYGVTLDSSGNIYVADNFNDRIQKFNSSGVYQSQFGTTGSGDGELNGPYDIAIDSSGNIYVADAGNNRIEIFNSSGVYQSQFGTTGSGDGEFQRPNDIAIDSNGNIYVADTGNDRIQKFNSSGVYQSQFGSYGSGDGEFYSPIGIAFDPSGNIYVADTGNDRIQKFNSSGLYQSQFGTSGSGDGEFNGPYGIAFDGSGNIYVGDSDNSRIQKFNSSGAYLSQFGSYGTGDGQFDFPTYLAISNTGNIIVSDSYNSRIQVFGPVPVYSTGPYSSEATGLTCGTTYHYRAYVTNAGGTYYGADQTFNTQGCPYVPSSTKPTSTVNPNPAPLVDLGIFTAIGRTITLPSAPGGILGYIYRFLQALPHNIVVALPYLLILLLLVVALAYGVQAWRDAVLAGMYKRQAKHKQNALDAQNNLYGIVLASGNEAMQNIKKALQGIRKVNLLNKFEVSAITASIATIAKQIQVSEWAGYNHTARLSSTKTSNQGKILRGFFNPMMWAPVLILGLVLVGLDLMLTRFSIASVSKSEIIIQVLLFTVCALVVSLVWLRVVRNRIVRENASEELSAVIMLMQANGAILSSVAEKSQTELDEINSIVRKVAHKKGAEVLSQNIKTLSALLASYGTIELLNRQELKSTSTAQLKSEIKSILDDNKRIIASKKLSITKNIANNVRISLSTELVGVLLRTNLENAFEIADKNGRVDVIIIQTASKVKLSIAGGGKALSRRMLHNLEVPLKNARKLDAIGAGLYLNQIIVESVGGKFAIASDSKTGTYVNIKLPKSNADVNNFKPNTELENPELAPFNGKAKLA